MSKPSNILYFCLMAFLVACSGSYMDKGQNKTAKSPSSGRIRASDEGITGIAAREVIRRQEQIRRSDAAAMEANRASSAGDHEAAIRSYQKALDTLPSED